jgi:zinc transport system substrate-binding protein
MRDELSAMLEGHPAKSMVWEGAPIEQNVKLLDERGLRSTTYDPCGNVPEEGDFLTTMTQNIENLSNALGK